MSNKSREVKFIILISKNPEPLLQQLNTPFLSSSPLQIKFCNPLFHKIIEMGKWEGGGGEWWKLIVNQ